MIIHFYQALLFVTVKSPETSTVFIDRFLIAAEAYSVPVCLVFNKIDLCDQDDMDYIDSLMILYQTIGYKCLKASLIENIGVQELRNTIKDKVSLLAGHSGVGKSLFIDTPGIKGFGTVNMTLEEVKHYFPEIFKFSHKCYYNNCMHINEPKCAVIDAVENHYISESRYHSYLNILGDIEEGKYR